MVATIVVSRWERELDKDRMTRVLNKESEAEAEEPEAVLEGLSVPDR
jgi:aerobic C4-dicarboxylate transport protein